MERNRGFSLRACRWDLCGGGRGLGELRGGGRWGGQEVLDGMEKMFGGGGERMGGGSCEVEGGKGVMDSLRGGRRNLKRGYDAGRWGA